MFRTKPVKQLDRGSRHTTYERKQFAALASGAGIMHEFKIIGSVRLSNNSDYLRDVLLNMEWIRTRDDRRVRFSTICDDGQSDYQTEYPPRHRLHGLPRRYDGHTHKFSDAPDGQTFDEEHLTEPYTWDDVLALLKQALESKDVLTPADAR